MTFSVALQESGGRWSAEATPLRFGPRHHGQSVALSAVSSWATTNKPLPRNNNTISVGSQQRVTR